MHVDNFEETAAVIWVRRLDGDGAVELLPSFADPGDLRDFREIIGGVPDKEGRFYVDAGQARAIIDRLVEAGFLVTGSVTYPAIHQGVETTDARADEIKFANLYHLCYIKGEI